MQYTYIAMLFWVPYTVLNQQQYKQLMVLQSSNNIKVQIINNCFHLKNIAYIYIYIYIYIYRDKYPVVYI